MTVRLAKSRGEGNVDDSSGGEQHNNDSSAVRTGDSASMLGSLDVKSSCAMEESESDE